MADSLLSLAARSDGHKAATYRGLDDVRNVVYALYCETTGLTKIGMTSHAARMRRAGVEKAIGVPCSVIAIEPCGKRAWKRERELFKEFAAFRRLGEWFALDADQRLALKRRMGDFS